MAFKNFPRKKDTPAKPCCVPSNQKPWDCGCAWGCGWCAMTHECATCKRTTDRRSPMWRASRVRK